MIQHLKLDGKYDEKDVEQIFTEIDHDSLGEINFNDFIQTLIQKSKMQETGKYFDFYLSTLNFYLTPSEQIVETIKRAITKLDIYEGETKLTKELKWVIQTISEKDLFDFRLKNDFIDKDELDKSEFLKFMSEYSTDFIKRQKDRDLESINTLHKKKKDCIILFNISKKILFLLQYQ